MSDVVHNGIPPWLLDTFCDPIWQLDQGPWRRHSFPVAVPEESWDDSTDEFLRPGYPHSEPDRDPPEWCPLQHTFPQGSEPIWSCHDASESTVVDLHTIMERMADPYWADRGWVLHLTISNKETKTN